MSAGSLDETPSGRHARIAAVVAECLSRRAAGESLSDARVIAEHPGLMPELREALASIATATSNERSDSLAETVSGPTPSTDSQSYNSIPGYRIERKLSEGGQGVVFLAVQQSTHRKVALKMMRGGALSSPGEKARF